MKTLLLILALFLGLPTALAGGDPQLNMDSSNQSEALFSDCFHRTEGGPNSPCPSANVNAVKRNANTAGRAKADGPSVDDVTIDE